MRRRPSISSFAKLAAERKAKVDQLHEAIARLAKISRAADLLRRQARHLSPERLDHMLEEIAHDATIVAVLHLKAPPGEWLAQRQAASIPPG